MIKGTRNYDTLISNYYTLQLIKFLKQFIGQRLGKVFGLVISTFLVSKTTGDIQVLPSLLLLKM